MMQRLLLICLLSTASGCAIHNKDFGCKVNDGLGCSSMSSINEMVDEHQEVESSVSGRGDARVKVWYRRINKDGEIGFKPLYVEIKGGNHDLK